MSKLALFQAAWAPRALSIMRIMAALVFLQHGLQKLVGFPPGPPGMAMPNPLPPIMLAAGILETVGGLLLLIGLFTRGTSFVLCGMMAVAYFMVHAPQGFYPIATGRDLAVVLCFLFLYMAFAGGGAWSVDAMRKGSVTNSAN